MNNKKYLHQELTGKIIHCCMDVHNELGCGFLEKVYQEALAIVLKEDGIEFERENTFRYISEALLYNAIT